MIVLDTIPVITKYSDKYNEISSHYIWVYAEEEKDLALDHPPVLDWQSGLENLEQLHVEPIKQKKIEDSESENGECVIIVQIDEMDECNLCKLQKTLESLSLEKASKVLGRFLVTKQAIYLDQVIKITRQADPVSCYKLCKIAKKAEVKRGNYQ